MTNLKEKIVTSLVAGSIGIGALTTMYSYFVPDTVQATIVDTQVKRYYNADKYLIFTDNGVFENTDAWYRFKFSSSDMQTEAMQLKGKQVEIEKYGWRNGLFSWYENVVDMKEIKK